MNRGSNQIDTSAKIAPIKPVIVDVRASHGDDFWQLCWASTASVCKKKKNFTSFGQPDK